MAAGPLDIGSTVTVGAEPHVHCAKCFAEAAESIDVKLPEGSLSGDVYDEKGRKLNASTEREDFTAPLRDSNVGTTENFPYGRPFPRR